MKTDDIRSAYLDFFADRDHRVVPSSSLVPSNDPTLLFTNAGMVQFKDALTGRETRGYRRATSCQRCVRAGGKHNDLENVGYTGRHQTLFEMLGNFSFGDYFKEEAITWAWEFVTSVLGLAKDRIVVTVHPTDAEARAIWTRKIGLASERVIDHEDNFWAMGDTGPCGPDSEFFYDLGPDVPGGPPGTPEEEGDRFCEFWNLVFPQFDRAPDGTLTPLDAPGVDTGMGLERVAAIVQGGKSNYDNDLIRQLVGHVAAVAGINDEAERRTNPSLRVIADHVRAAAFLIGDGVMPSNEDRGYVLRRIIRRGLRHGHKLGIDGLFFHRLVQPVTEVMAVGYPDIGQQADRIAKILTREEERFGETLRAGMSLLDSAIADLKGTTIAGETVFKLYDTYGFPADLTADIARERGLSLDQAGFEERMNEQRARGRAAAGRFDASFEQSIRVDSAVTFSGYDALTGEASVLGLFADGSPVESLATGAKGVVVLESTPFYAEAGGQVGDAGTLEGSDLLFQVEDTTKAGDQHLHHGHMVRGTVRTGDRINATVTPERRRETALNHSATHLLHAALRETLGSHVEQKGSLVAPDRLRFDFGHPMPLTDQQLARVETTVNERIRENSPVVTNQMTYDEAIASGAVALFGEKYGDSVRVLNMGDGFSVELCGGTHVKRTGDIGLLRIVAEEGIAAGIRRIEAATGARALAWTDDGERELLAAAEALRAGRLGVLDKVQRLLAENKRLAKEVEALNAKLAAGAGVDLAAQAVDVGGIQVLATTVDGSADALPTTLDALRNRLGDSVIVLGHVGAKVSLIAGVSKSLTDRMKAGELLGFVGKQVGAKGGGRPDMARGGGGDRPEALPNALAQVPDWVRGRIGPPAD